MTSSTSLKTYLATNFSKAAPKSRSSLVHCRKSSPDRSSSKPKRRLEITAQLASRATTACPATRNSCRHPNNSKICTRTDQQLAPVGKICTVTAPRWNCRIRPPTIWTPSSQDSLLPPDSRNWPKSRFRGEKEEEASLTNETEGQEAEAGTESQSIHRQAVSEIPFQPLSISTLRVARV